MTLARAIATVGSITMLSRILGFVRDMLMSRYLGAGMAADAFFVAFRLPNLFRSLFAEGAFTAAFLPLFSATMQREGCHPARLLAEEALAMLTALLIGFCIVMSIAMPLVTVALAAGFADNPAQFDLTVAMGRVMFPYLALISATALFGSVLNALGRYGPFAAAPILLNIVQIAGLLLSQVVGVPVHWVLSLGVPLAGIAQLVWMIVACKRAGFALRLRRPRLTPQVKRLFANLGPGILGAGVYQFNLLIGTNLASWLAVGSVSYLQYADRLNQLPMAVVGVAIGSALLPLLSRQAAAGDAQGTAHSLARSLEFGLALGLPAALALIAVPSAFVHALFQGGAFGAEAVAPTAAALRAYAIGIPAFIAAKALSAAFFARQDPKGPVRIAIFTLAVNAALSLALIGPLGHVGLALAPGLTAWLNTALLAAGLVRRKQAMLDERLKRMAPRILIAALGMTGLLLGLERLLSPWLYQASTLPKIAALAGLITAALIAYAGLCFMLGAARLAEIKGLLRRSDTHPPPPAA
jgi:putative peptidoglycan lipid II flippase